MSSASITQKIYTGISILILGYLLSAAYMVFINQELRNHLDSISTENFPHALISNNAVLDFDQAMEAYELAGMLGEVEKLEEASKKYKHTIEGMEQIVEKSDNSSWSRLLDELKDTLPALNNMYTELANGNFDDSLAEQTKTLNQKTKELRAQLATVSQENVQIVTKQLEAVGNDNLARQKYNWGIFIAAAILSYVFTYLVIRNTVIRPINSILKRLQVATENVRSAGYSLHESSIGLAQDSSIQAESLEKTASSIEEMSSQAKGNATNAGECQLYMNESGEKVKEGVQSMGQMNTIISEIENASQETAKIIKTIDEIAFQTNILALNAAVEAARAGDAGSGFAVVAEEVRALAQRSAEAASNTASLLENMQTNVGSCVRANELTSTNLDEIRITAEKAQLRVEEITTASQQQSEGIEEVNSSIAEIDRIVQTHAVTAQDTAKVAENLSTQIEDVNSMLLELNLIANGSSRKEGSSGPVKGNGVYTGRSTISMQNDDAPLTLGLKNEFVSEKRTALL